MQDFEQEYKDDESPSNIVLLKCVSREMKY
jgi:hypothetical protein